MPMNQKYMVPRLTQGEVSGSGPGFALSRRNILNGNVKVFPGPGQQPQAAAGGSYYTPPDDWTPAGFALRRPEIVWINSPNFYGNGASRIYGAPFIHPSWSWQNWDSWSNYLDNILFYILPPYHVPVYEQENHGDHYHMDVYGRGAHIVDYSRGAPLSVFPGTSTHTEDIFPGDPPPSQEREIPDAWQPAGEAISEVVSSVSINRPGLTWVVPPEICSQSIFDPFLYYPHAAPFMREPYFGTNFLHITIGPPFVHSEDYDTEAFTLGLEIIKKCKDTMAGFTVEMYGQNVYSNNNLEPMASFSKITVDPESTRPPEVTAHVANASKTFVYPDWGPIVNDEVTFYSHIQPAIISATNRTDSGLDATDILYIQRIKDKFDEVYEAANNGITASNEFVAGQDSDANEGIADFITASNAMGANYVNMGNDGDILTAADLIKNIADHFGFDL